MSESQERFFTKEQEEKIVAAIQQAESVTSGEIRVHLETRSGKDPFKRAQQVFADLGMHKTDLRNGVLFYLATEDHKFTILGDQGIDKVVPDHFWEDVRDIMQAHFRAGRFEEGLSEGIAKAGEQLAKYFPVQDDDQNELSDEITES